MNVLFMLVMLQVMVLMTTVNVGTWNLISFTVTVGYSSVLAWNPGTSWSNNNALVAVKSDMSVECWGDSSRGGSCSNITDVVTVYSTRWAFAAVK